MSAHGDHSMTPKQLIYLVLAAFIVPVVLITLVVKVVLGTDSKTTEQQKKEQVAVVERIKPLGQVGLVNPNAPQKSGEEVYNAFCASCHATGAANAPKLGDLAAWAKRITKGQAALVASAVAGIPGTAMSAKGGADVTDDEFARAVVFLANKSGAKFTEPTAAPAVDKPTEQPVAAKPATLDGKSVYEANCAACHNAGIANAPKLGDKAAWAARIKQGVAVLTQHAVSGFKTMPAKGGNTALSDAEVKAAVEHMANAVK